MIGTLELKRSEGGLFQASETELRSIAGELITPQSHEYDAARAVWNGMIDKRPGAIARPATESQAQALVLFAARNGILFSTRGRGHNIAGSAVCEGGLVIDLANMNAVSVDPARMLARVGPGASLGDLDAATQAHGLVVPTGINSTTGVAGLTLGGGFGWTTRKFGLTIDNLRSARVIIASGEVVTASESENPDLFWALRGGGGNFGLVTQFEFELHRLGPQVFAGLAVHRAEHAVELLCALQSMIDSTEDDLTIWAVLRQAPPLPFLPEAWHGERVVIVPFCYTGALNDAEKATEGVRTLGDPIAVHAGPSAFCDWQKSFDPLLAEGARNYWKSHDLASITKPVAETVAEALAQLPTEECEVFFGEIGGVMTRIEAAATAWPNRTPHYALNIHTRWRDAADDARCVAWARELFDRLAPHSMGTSYSNFIPAGDVLNNHDSAYGGNLKRLLELKSKWDPTGLFQGAVDLQPV